MTASTIAASPGLTLVHRPWWRSRATIVGAIVGVMVICHLTLSRTVSWPDSLVWHSLNHYLDNLQNWLAAESAKSHPNFAYQLIHWISSGLDALVRWLYHLLSNWLTWPGTPLLGGLLAWRFGGRRAPAILAPRFGPFAPLGLWAARMQRPRPLPVALSMVVIAGLINTEGGLGAPVTNGLNSDPALAILAGAAIVVMAFALDRVTEAIAERTDPAQRHLDVVGRKRARLLSGAVFASVAVAAILGHLLSARSAYTRSTAQDWLRTQVQSVLDYVQKPTTR